MPNHANSSGPDIPAFQNSLVKAAAIAKASDMDVIYLCPTLDTLDSHAAITVLGEAQIAEFKKKRVMTINGVNFHLETGKHRRANGPTIVFAVYASTKLLNKAIADHRTTDWVYLPWAPEELSAYLLSHPDSDVI